VGGGGVGGEYAPAGADDHVEDAERQSDELDQRGVYLHGCAIGDELPMLT
jgi:hypothetical protein